MKIFLSVNNKLDIHILQLAIFDVKNYMNICSIRTDNLIFSILFLRMHLKL